jgi:hypothetical protein
MRYLQSKSVFEHYLRKFDQSIIDECKDILLELEDIGIKTLVNTYSALDKNWIQFFFTRKEEFDYSDIEDVVERLKSYLLEYDLHIDWLGTIERLEQRPEIRTIKVMNPMTFASEGFITKCDLHFSTKIK